MRAAQLLVLVLAAGCSGRTVPGEPHGEAGLPDGGWHDAATTDGLPPVPCTPGAFLRCEAGAALHCPETGTGQVATACPYGCNAQAGRCDECAPGVTSCQSDQLVTCSVSGLAALATDCPFGCDESVSPPACRPCDGCPTCPGDMVLVTEVGVCIDRYEASASGAGLRAASLAGAMPWTYVSWFEAAAACEGAGKRLCTDAEWLAACGGPSRTVYPYGDTFAATACNGHVQGPDAPAATGAFPECEGAYPGLFDMSGNVYEWTATCPADTLCHGRGGDFFQGEGGLPCDGPTLGSNPSVGWELLGFRCCRAP